MFWKKPYESWRVQLKKSYWLTDWLLKLIQNKLFCIFYGLVDLFFSLSIRTNRSQNSSEVVRSNCSLWATAHEWQVVGLNIEEQVAGPDLERQEVGGRR